MSPRTDHLDSIAATIGDYRKGEIASLTPEHIDRWVRQFSKPAQVPILAELDHVFKQTYISKEAALDFLSKLLKPNKLFGKDPCVSLRVTEFISNQGGGNSQRDLLGLFTKLVNKVCGFEINQIKSAPSQFVYLDDGVFSGNRVKADMQKWVKDSAIDQATVNIVALAIHTGGQFYANTEIIKLAKELGKDIKIGWWRILELEDRKAYMHDSDVLRPTQLPHDPDVANYAQNLRFPVVFRRPGSTGKASLFSSDAARQLLEHEMLTAGVRIRSMCPYLNTYQRPLGYSKLETLGFGSLLVTYRNCPNNTPLAFWAGDPWYPLFPRKIN